MGVDIATFRARIGSFVPKKKATSPEHVKLLRLPVRTMFGFARLLTIATVMFILLASAGDVETNPGPTNAEKIDNLQHAIEALIAATNKNQQETSIKLDQINSGIAALGTRVSKVEGQVKEIPKIQENLSTIETTVNSIKCDSISFRDHLTEMNTVVDDLENRMRRNNLIFKGLPELENETWNDAKVIITGFAQEMLGISLGEIERAHRLGQKRSGTKRPIIVKFLSFRDREEVLRNAFKLKNVTPPIRISEDFSDKVRSARQKLWEFAEQFRESGTKYKIIYNKLHVGTQSFIYDSASDSVVSLRTRRDVTARND